MRVNESIAVSAPTDLVWEYLSDPANYLHFMSGVTRWEVEGDRPTGLGARYRILMRVGSSEVGGLVEVVEFRSERDMAWSSVTGIDQRGRWRLRERSDGRTNVEFRYAYGIAGAGISGYVAELVAAPMVRRNVRRSLQQLKRQVELRRRRGEMSERSHAHAQDQAR